MALCSAQAGSIRAREWLQASATAALSRRVSADKVWIGMDNFITAAVDLSKTYCLQKSKNQS